MHKRAKKAQGTGGPYDQKLLASRRTKGMSFNLFQNGINYSNIPFSLLSDT